MNTRILFGAIALSLCPLLAPQAQAADWMQFGYDAAHSGNNPDETTITLANVAQLTKLYPSVTMAATVDSAPAYRSNVVTPGGTKNLLFALSENGRLMAIDAVNGAEVWFKTTTGTQPTASSPAIDPDGAFVYSYGIDGKVHKYQSGDGTEIVSGGWPQISTLKPSVEKGQAGLAIAGSRGATWLYSVTDGYIGDGGDYQGHITTIDLASGAQNVFNTLCSNMTIHFVLNGTAGVNDCGTRMSGIWGRGGAVYDAGTDRVYITTGNGLFNAHTGGKNWGDSVLALNTDGTGAGGGLPLDSYTPTTYATLESLDKDLGSVSLAILPAPAGSTIAHLGLQTGKDSKLHLINLDNMSGAGGPAHVGGELQSPTPGVPQGGTVFAQPAVWVDATGVTWTFVATASGIAGLKVCFNTTCTASSGTPMLVSQWTKTGSSTSPILANGVLYHVGTCGGSRCMVARNPLDGTQLWSDNIGTVHWGSPILVNGTLFMMDRSKKLSAYGLSGAPTTHTVTPTAGAHGSIAPATPQTVNDGATTSFALTPDAHYRIDTVTGCGGSLNGLVYTTAPVSTDCTVSATFAIITHTVTPLASGGGMIAPAAPQTIDDGATANFTLTPAAGHALDAVNGCGGSLGGATYTTAAITQDCTVSAVFAPDGSDRIFRDGFDPATN